MKTGYQIIADAMGIPDASIEEMVEWSTNVRRGISDAWLILDDFSKEDDECVEEWQTEWFHMTPWFDIWERGEEL